MGERILQSSVAAASEPDYWQRRQGLMYYRYVDLLVRALAADARSLIDVGSRNTPLIEDFGWIPRRVALDLVKPYQSANVPGIRADFLSYVPEQRFDFALCLQVLEHIPDVQRFARHLFEVADSVLVSVPYRWPPGNPHHVHDPVDLNKLIGWMGRKPDHDLVVTEPLSTRRRLIAYFHSPRTAFSKKAAATRLAGVLAAPR